MRLPILASLVVASAVNAFAQLPPMNDAGVTVGHIHFMVPDVEPTKKAWVDVFGAVPTKAGSMEMLKLPGVFVIVMKSAAPPAGGTMGSVVHHVGLSVKDFADTKAKALAAKLPFRELTPNIQAFITFPEDVTVEIMEDKTQNAPVAFHHIHESVVDGEGARAWYMKEFGATSGSRRNLPAAMMTGKEEVDFLKANMPAAPTKGRALDHIGFDVKDLAATLKRLEADGVTVSMPMRDMTKQIELKIAFITDPNGTYIELTEGMSAK